MSWGAIQKIIAYGDAVREDGHRQGWLTNLECLPGYWSSMARRHYQHNGGKLTTGRALLREEIARVEQGIREKRPEAEYSKQRLRRLRRHLKALLMQEIARIEQGIREKRHEAQYNKERLKRLRRHVKTLPR